MSPADALPLRDIHLPADPSWWPPAPGWWLLVGLMLLLVGWLGRRLLRALRRRRQRRALQRAWRALQQVHPLDQAPVALLAAASELLRRACKRHAPSALALHGEAWLAFLDHGLPDAPFSSGPGRLLLDGPYRARLDPSAVQALLPLIERRLLSLPAEGGQ